MPLDKWIAALFLVGALVYGYAAFTYPLLPFERAMAFLPNTLPKMISILAAVLALLILIAPAAPREAGEESALGTLSLARLRQMRTGQALVMVLAMIAYALALRPLGFVAATVIFLAGTGLLLGERRYLTLVLVAALGAGFVWVMVDPLLGIFLRPLPWFMG